MGAFANVVAAELFQRALGAAASIWSACRGRRSPPSRRSMATSATVRRIRSRARRIRARRGISRPRTDRRGRIWRKIGVTLERLGRYDEAQTALLEALLASATGMPTTTFASAPPSSTLSRASLQGALRRRVEHADAAIALAGDRGRPGIGRPRELHRGPPTTTSAEKAVVRTWSAPSPCTRSLATIRGLGSSLNNLGIHHYTRGEWDHLGRHVSPGPRGSRASRRPAERRRPANNEAEVLSDQGGSPRPSRSSGTWCAICRGSGFPIGEALGTSNLGRVAARARAFDEAHGLYEDAERLFGEIGSKRYATETRARVAEVFVFEGRHRGANDRRGVPR